MMHGPHCTAPSPPPSLPLPLLLLMLLCGASVCLSAAAAQASSGNWDSLRIHVSTKDLDDPARYCNESGVNRTDFQGGTSECYSYNIVTAEMKTTIISTIIPAAVKLHTDRLLVQRLSSPLKVPQFDAENPCWHFTVPSDHHTAGVSNADIVLYVAVAPEDSFASVCSLDTNGRPIVAAVALAYYSLALRHAVRFTAHSIAQALGFNYGVMMRRGMLSNIPVGGKQVTVVKSANTLAKAREHYNCSTLQGMRVDHWNSMAYWEGGVARDELMSETSDFLGFYTALTMAAFEDLGFFRALSLAMPATSS